MCCSLAPAEFSHTQVYAGDALRDGKVVHVLAYANHAHGKHVDRMRARARTRDDDDTDPDMVRPALAAKPGLLARLFGKKRAGAEEGAPENEVARGNAMLLHFPAAAPMGEANIVDTTHSKGFLYDMQWAVWPRMLGDEADAGEITLSAAVRPQAKVFESGDYTVVLAEDARAIPAALARVPAAKRPAPNPAVFDWYAQRFPRWPVALCCFADSVAHDPAPLLWWYEPLVPDELFAPGFDAHDGAPPRVGADVHVDHRVFFGSQRAEAGHKVSYSGSTRTAKGAAVRALLPNNVVGSEVKGTLANGDFYAKLIDVQRGQAAFARR